jgi:putative Holliday junction resolvase
MPRILCIDYGKKRTGIAVTDPLKIIATALTTIETSSLINFLKKYFNEEKVELVLIGEPKNLDDTDTHATPLVNQFIQKFKKEFPLMKIEKVDERYSSKMAVQSMVAMGMKQKERRKKENIDKIAAAMMLQEYLTLNP